MQKPRLALAIEEAPSNTISAAIPAGAGSAAERLSDVRISEMMESHLLPLLARLRDEIRTLAHAGRRGEVAEHVDRIDELARAAQASAAAFVALMALDERDRPLDLAMVDLGDILMALLARWKTRAPSHAFELALPGEIPLISADSALAEVALDALIEDAVALTAPGDTIRVSIRPDQEGVVVSVRAQTAQALSAVTEPEEIDGRAGEPLDQQPNVEHNRITRALASAIVERHGGHVWAERDRPDAGPTLRASWRLVARPQPRRESPVELQSAGGRVAGAMPRSATTNGVRLTALVWEPDPRMARYLRSNLESRQLRPIMAATLDDVSRLVAHEEPDLLLLDVSNDERDLTTIEHVLRLTPAPALLLAGDYDAEICARLLDAGAADYIAKPLHIDELFARVRVALRARRGAEMASPETMSFHSGELTIDFAQRRVTLGEREVPLSKTEFKLLRALAQNAGKVLAHDWLLEHVWGAGYRHETEFIWVYVRRLRRKIEPDPKHPRYVITVPGVGYRLAKKA